MGPDSRLYDLLEIELKASDDEIKHAFKKMAVKYHPDKNRDDPEVAKMYF